MSIYNRALSDAPQVDRRIVRAVDRVIRSLPTPGGVFGRDDVWSALQANAKELRVPLDLDAVQVQKALDALCLACILTCRGGAYSVVAAVPPLKVEAPAVPADLPPPAAEVEPIEPDEAVAGRTTPSAFRRFLKRDLPPALADVVALLRQGPMSSADLRTALDVTPSTITTRLSRLMLIGVVQKGAQIPSLHGGMPRYLYELAPLGTREVPSPAPAAEVVFPAPVKAEPWTARPKQGPDEQGRWRWEARATLETRVSRGLGWLAEDEVLPALRALGQAPAPADHADLLAALKWFAPYSVDATTPAEALTARVQGALRYIAEIEAEGRRLADLCNEAHSELDAAGAPDGTPAERVRWLVDQRNGTREALDACDSLLPLHEQARRVADEVVQLRAIAHVPEGPILERLQTVLGAWEHLLSRIAEAERAERQARALQSELEDIRRDRTAGPAWPSLRNLDVDRDEAAIAEIERRCAAWRTLLQAAREVEA